jgi:ABC-2 type transport system permease protein
LSRRIAHAFLPPYFLPAQSIVERNVVPLMNAGKYTFVLDIPPHFERGVLRGRQPRLQVNVDATAMVQAGLGADYAQQIISTEIGNFLSRAEGVAVVPVNLVVRIAFNPNVKTAWFSSIMGIINSLTMLAIVLAGAALVREREHGTMDHLLVMPLRPFEIALSKIWANGLVIVIAVGLGARPARHPNRRVAAAVPGRGCDLPVLCRRRGPSARHDCTLNAAARSSLPARLSAARHAVG